MKKTLFGLGLFIAFSMIFVGCPSPNSAKTEELSLTEKIAKAEGSIDFENLEIAEDASVDSKVTIKNLKLGGKTLTINASDTVLENVSNAVIIISEDVGDGNVTISGCKDISKLTINGGGANSVHITNSEIAVVEVAKESVRVALEGTSKVEAVSVTANSTKIESDDGAKITKLTVKNDVDKVTLSGGTITKLEVEESTEPSANTPEIVIADKIEITEITEDVKVTISEDVDADVVKIPEAAKPAAEPEPQPEPEPEPETEKESEKEGEPKTEETKEEITELGLSVSIEAQGENPQITYTKDGTTYTLTVSGEYDSYMWMINEIKCDSETKTLVFDTADLPEGTLFGSSNRKQLNESNVYNITAVLSKDTNIVGTANLTLKISE
ncbi:MAG: hypothetical protein IJ688_07410 [Treponema sp.]|nr:hypothetical protein [Treponema sp.]